MSFGTELRVERERLGVSLQDIAAGTRVSERYLRALEADQHRELPGGVFNKGMVRSYCRHVGLDEGEWLQRFGEAFPVEGGETDWAAFAENVKLGRPQRTPTGMRWWGVVLMLGTVVALAWSTWHFVLKRRLGLLRPEGAVIRWFPAEPSAPKKTRATTGFGA